MANATLVRYVDDVVILARYQVKPLKNWVEHIQEKRLGLTINRAKTRIVKLRELGEGLDFQAYSVKFDGDFKGRDHK